MYNSYINMAYKCTLLVRLLNANHYDNHYQKLRLLIFCRTAIIAGAFLTWNSGQPAQQRFHRNYDLRVRNTAGLSPPFWSNTTESITNAKGMIHGIASLPGM